MSKIAEFEAELGKRVALETRITAAETEITTAQAQLEDLEKEVNPNFTEIQVLVKTISDKKEEITYYNNRLLDIQGNIQSMKAEVEFEIKRTAHLTIKEPLAVQFKALVDSFILQAETLEADGKSQSETYITSINPDVMAEINGYGARFEGFAALSQMKTTIHKYM